MVFKFYNQTITTMKISLDFQLKGLNGQDLEGDGAHTGKIIAGSLAQANKGASIKLYDWASKLWNKDAIEIDDTDKDVLIGFIETAESLTNLSKAQALKVIKSQAEAQAAKKVK